MIVRLCIVFFLTLFPLTAGAQSLSLIQDDETERILANFLLPLFKKAELNVAEMQIHLVKDDSINAFAAKGLHVFIHTGLLTKADDAQEVIAVLAHETGHIAGGHIVRLYDNIRITQRNMLISMLLAGLAGAASGRVDVGMATMMGAQTSAQSLLMGYRRTEENAADQFAVTVLTQTGHGLLGFEEMMKKLQAQENYQIDPKTDVLWRTHPDVKDRLSFILNQKKKYPPANATLIRQENKAFKRIQAKLYAFLYPPEKTFLRYPETDGSIDARYARAIAAYRSGKAKTAVAIIDVLIKEEPENPYFYELKGQILFETGNAKEAVHAYQKAVLLRPDSVLLRIGLGQAQTEADSRENLLDALDNLSIAAERAPDSAFVWRLLAVAHGKLGQFSMADYALAEYNFKNNDLKQAERFAKKALEKLPATSSAALRADDILMQVRSNKHNTKM